MKKILHLSKYSNADDGGIERVVYNTTAGLKNDYKHIVLSFNKHNDSNHVKQNNNIQIHSKESIISLFSQPINFHYFWNVKKYTEAKSPDRPRNFSDHYFEYGKTGNSRRIRY